MKPLYLVLDALVISFPLIRSFEPKVHYKAWWPSFFKATAIIGSIFIIWDILFTNLQVWSFNPKYLIGFNIFNLPIEEWLFFINVPFACVFIYACLKTLVPLPYHKGIIRFSTLLLGIAILLIGLLYLSKIYTSTTFIITGLLLLFTAYKIPSWLNYFWVTYIIHLIPFIITNSILTGSFIQEPIVQYNNEENLGIRIFTMPIEDSIYSLLLLLGNIWLIELFRSKQT